MCHGKNDLRDRPKGEMLFLGCLKKLIENNKPFITLSGDKNLRLEKAISIDDLTKVKEMGCLRLILFKFISMEYQSKI
jgi:hypothetical protein